METFVSIPDYRSSGTPLVFTEAAARKVHELIVEEGNPGLKLRVYISGGGCSGFQYGFSFDEAQAEDDFAIDREGVFVIRNPNAKTTCGCGSSFST
jgi:iron-sulfur cluster insertion protein